MRIAILDVVTGEVKWVDPGVKDREVQLQAPLWNDDGTKAVLVARATDNKDRWILGARSRPPEKRACCSPSMTTRG